MTIIIFIIILAILILVHEFGHFIVAKKSGVRADEFGIGFPPRLLKLFRWKGTDFTLNAIPFGGFVRIFGENPEEEEIPEDQKSEHFAHKPKKVQALIIGAGVLFNFLFAWILISAGFMYGLPSPQDPESSYNVENARLVITSVLENSPAFEAGIQTGDVVSEVSSSGSNLSEINPDTFSEFIVGSNEPVSIALERGEEEINIEIIPEEGIEGIEEGKKAIGVSMGMIGTLKLPFHLAIWEGTKTSFSLFWTIATGLVTFFSQIILGQADFSQVAGPVGIVGLVGDASQLGFVYILQFTAFISLNLAVINLIPFPALDGGRLFFLAIEAIKGKKMNPKVVNAMNAIGFVLLILLMVIITIKDLQRIF